MKAIEGTPFCSFGPSYDSRFANLSKEDSDLLISSHHSEDDLTHVADIKNAIGRAMTGNVGGTAATGLVDYELDAVDGLLNALSGGEYLKQSDVVESRQQFCEMEEKIRAKSVGLSASSSADATGVVTKAGDEPLKAPELTAMDELLASAASQLESLRQLQLTRLSRPPPPHLALVRPASAEELGMADDVTTSLTAMAKKVTPEYLVSQRALFEALGVDLAREAAPEEEEEKPVAGDEEKEATPKSEEVMDTRAPVSRLETPTTPVARCQVPQNVFQRTFPTGISFAATS